MVNKRAVLVVMLALVFFAYTTFAEVRFIRKSWEVYTPQERELYKKAVTAAMKSGHHLLFTKITMEDDGLEQVRNTRAEPAWYRKWLVGYETMLQSQGDEFIHVTLPYWNFFEDAAKRLSSRVSCNSLVACSSFLTDLGAGDGDPYRGQYIVNGVTAQGNCANKSIAASACTSLEENHVCEHCIPRGDWDIEQSTFEFGPSAFVEVLKHAVASHTPMDTLRTSIATRFHYILHNLLGGVYETKAAAFDPIFIGHYTMIDLIYTIYQRSHPADKTETSSSSIPMVLDGYPVEFHPIVGSFFDGTPQEMGDTRIMNRGYDYELDGFLQTMLDTFSIGSQEGLQFTQHLSLSADREASQGFVKAIATCNASTLTGTTDEAPYTAIVCELMSKQQNGVYTNFSTITRDAWNVPSGWLPTCVPLLQSVAKGTIQLQVTDLCRQAFMNETSISTNDFSTKNYGLAIVTRGKDGFVKRVPGRLGR